MAATPIQLAAARLRCSEFWPYLSSALWSMVPVEAPGLGTLGVDRYWRLYYDPVRITEWTVEELTGVLYHEVSHLLRDHSARAENLGAPCDVFHSTKFNIAGDMEINDDLKAEKVTLPEVKDKDGKVIGTCIYPETYGLEPNKFAEEYYHLLDDILEFVVYEVEMEGDGSSTANGDSGSMSPSSSANGSSSSKVKRIKIKVDKDGNIINGPCNCGSGADGQKRKHELGDPDGSDAKDGISKADAEMIKREVARRILESSNTRGNIPGSWKRWAEQILEPKINWRKEIPAAIRNALGHVAGMVDYRYNKPSRRQSCYPDIVMPALRQPSPNIAILIDTSGSMGDDKVCQCLGEVKGVLKSCGIYRDLTVLFIDAAVHSVKKVFDVKKLVPIGGGGTDMTVGIDYANTKLKPRPDVLIVLSDCETPWPKEPPQRMKLIIGRIGKGDVPAWAKVVDIDL